METLEEIQNLLTELANLKSRQEEEGLTVMEIKQNFGRCQARLATLLGIEEEALESYMDEFHATAEWMDEQIQAKIWELEESAKNAVREAQVNVREEKAAYDALLWNQ